MLLGVVVVFGVLLALDLRFKGLVWRGLQQLKSPNTSSLPNEKRTIGNTHRTDITFLS